MIDAPKLVWGATDWLTTAAILGVILLALLILGYWRVGRPGVRLAAASLKVVAILILVLCLLDPLFAGNRARPGANQFVVLVDNSQSMTLKDAGSSQTRGEQFEKIAADDAPWLAHIGRDFDLRQFSFDSQLKNIDSFTSLSFDGRASNMGKSLENLIKRYQGRPLAGILLFTDGSATDADAVARVIALASAKGDASAKVPPIYPVLMGKNAPVKDINLEHISVSQTNFEDAPVTLTAQMATAGMKGRTVAADLLDEKGAKVDEQTARVEKDGDPLVVRFHIKPDDKDQDHLSFYQVRVSEQGRQTDFLKPEGTDEATLANNTRMAVVDRGKGPFRVLYVGGRPNFEFKFLNRSVAQDDQIQLVGLIRVAKREPKFNFIGRVGDGETVNPLFSGFAGGNPEDTQQYDQPVIVRVGVSDQNELNAGFPKTAEELFAYQALVIDDVESDFFNQDQMQLIKDFVRQRGGGMLMLGGVDTYKSGKYERTMIGDMLPVYMDDAPPKPATSYSLALTREGWLEPWLRLRADESSEQSRLDGMDSIFQVVTQVHGIKPGATVLANVIGDNNTLMPALVEQRFGKGRVDAMLIGDLWQWEMHRTSSSDTDFEKAWRQTVRWLVSDVPQRIDVAVDTAQRADDVDGTVRLIVQARDKAYAPLDNATVTVKITPPDGKPVEMRAEPSEKQPGQYEALYVPRLPGAYRAGITVAAMDGTAIGDTRTGWTSDPAAEEFRDLQPDATLLARIAKSTGGEMIDPGNLDAFAENLPLRQAQVMEPYVQPFWHQSWVFLLAIGLLAAEWGLRRMKGLP